MAVTTWNERISLTLAVFENAVYILTAPRPWVGEVPPTIHERLHDAVAELLPHADGTTNLIVPASLQEAFQAICRDAGYPRADLRATLEAMTHHEALELRQRIIDLDARLWRWGVVAQLPDPSEDRSGDGSMVGMRTSAMVRSPWRSRRRGSGDPCS
jgi:hypothetical protein